MQYNDHSCSRSYRLAITYTNLLEIRFYHHYDNIPYQHSCRIGRV